MPATPEQQEAIMTTVKSQLAKIHGGNVEILTTLLDEIAASALPQDEESTSTPPE